MYFRAALKYNQKVLVFTDNQKTAIHKVLPKRAKDTDFNMVNMLVKYILRTCLISLIKYLRTRLLIK